MDGIARPRVKAREPLQEREPDQYVSVSWLAEFEQRLRSRGIEVVPHAEPSHSDIVDRDLRRLPPFKPSGESKVPQLSQYPQLTSSPPAGCRLEVQLTIPPLAVLVWAVG